MRAWWVSIEIHASRHALEASIIWLGVSVERFAQLLIEVLWSEGGLPPRNPSAERTRACHLRTSSYTSQNDVGRFASCLLLS